MTEISDQATEIRVKFGARPDDTMPLSWAERLLTWLRTSHPNVFADGMFSVLDIERKRRS